MTKRLTSFLTTPAALWSWDTNRSVAIGQTGLLLGAGTLLVRMATDDRLALDTDRERLLTLLSVACRRPIGRNALAPIEVAADHWQRGDKALANLRLVFAGLPRLVEPADVYRLQLAEHLLDEGMRPYDLMTELGLDPSLLGLLKYDQDQPRVPAGNGRQSGRWSSAIDPVVIDHDGSAAAANVTPAALAIPAAVVVTTASAEGAGTLASGLFETGAAVGEFLGGLAALGAIIGTGIAAGAIFIPSPNDVTSEGAIPGDPKLRYSFIAGDTLLHLTQKGENGTEMVAVAQRGHDGIFYETETGIPVARDVGGSIVFDSVSLATVAPAIGSQARAAVQYQAEAETDKPQLCPAQGPDVAHGALERAHAYQEQISALNNPQQPLKRGMAVSLLNPQTRRRVVYDDCRTSDGTMIEAKGPGYAKLLRYNYFNTRVMPERWKNQAGRQIDASGGRGLDWFFAEGSAAARAREIFNENSKLSRINIFTVPAIVK